MRLTKLFLIFLFGAIISISGYAQTIRSEQVKARLIELFELCKNRDYEKAASYIVYRGNDTSRVWRDVYSFDNIDEQKYVVEVCEEIRSYFYDYKSYEFSEFKTERESEGLWCIWKVVFSEETNKNIYFAFLKIKGEYALGDID